MIDLYYKLEAIRRRCDDLVTDLTRVPPDRYTPDPKYAAVAAVAKELSALTALLMEVEASRG